MSRIISQEEAMRLLGIVPPERKIITTFPELLTRFGKDFPFFARHCLRIDDKAGHDIPFIFNRAQMHTHTAIESQKRRKGMVRAILLKGRQQGLSTYADGRGFYKAAFQGNVKGFIMAHAAKSTSALFDKIKTFHSRMPDLIRPVASTNNQNEIVFDAKNSRIGLGTAGTKTIGRGFTLQYLHGSEVAYWDNGASLVAGLMQAVGDIPGTEIIFESTANGMTNIFYELCNNALQGKGEFELIFIPWFWQPEYRADPGPGFEPTEEEFELVRAYQLDAAQLAFRRNKIISLGSEWSFKQEYPCNPVEAFQTSMETLCRAEDVISARKTAPINDPNAPLIFGIDQAYSSDRFVVAKRRGRTLLETVSWERLSPTESIARVAEMIRNEQPDRVFVDTTNEYSFYEWLKELGFKGIVMPVCFSEKSIFPEKFVNKRAEILYAVREWLHGGDLFRPGTVSIPDEDDLHAELLSVPNARRDGNGRFFIIPKDDIKRKFGRSPDKFDAIALTFAWPVPRRVPDSLSGIGSTAGSGAHGITTMRQLRGSGPRVTLRR